ARNMADKPSNQPAPHATSDTGKANATEHVKTHDKFRAVFDISKSQANATTTTNHAQTVNTQDSHQREGPPASSPSVDIHPVHNQTIASGASVEPQPTPVEAKSTSNIFLENLPAPVMKTALPTIQDRIEVTQQLVYCSALLLRGLPPFRANAHKSEDETEYPAKALLETETLDQKELDWLAVMDNNPSEQERIRWLGVRMVDEFAKDVLKDSTEIAEIVLLGSILDKETYRSLLSCTIAAFEQSVLLNVDLLHAVVQLVQDAPPESLISDDLVRIFSLLRVRIQSAHQQSSVHSFNLTLALSRLLDVMAEHKVKDMNRVEDHEPLSGILSGLKGNSEPYLMYQACYAFQALQYVPNDETPLETVLRHSTGVVDGLVKVSAVFKLDLSAVLEGLGSLQEALGSAVGAAVTVYEGVNSLMESGRGVLDGLKEGFAAGKKCPWYATIRTAQTLVQAGQLKDLNQLIREAPCRRDPLFQWGICQLLGEIASDDIWAATVRQQAVDLLGYLYKDDSEWGQDESVKTWMLNIMRQLTTIVDQAVSSYAQTLLKELNQDQGTTTTTRLPYPLRNRLSLPPCSPILTRVLRIPDVEYSLRNLRQQRLEEHRKGVYIPPQAKASLQASDDTLFALMEKVQEFLAGQKQVFLVLGDSGAGKSTFNIELEHTLWYNYKKYGQIPLYINLPTIDDPEHGLIDKQLQYHNFSEDQIHEMKLHREFILICDGYDESQLKTNIHTTNQFNQPGQWQVKIVISCRTQYLGQDYRPRFQPQPADRYQRTTVNQFQEAVVAAFSRAQVQQYVDEYVKELPAVDPIQKKPSWTAKEYMDKLVNIQSLMDLVSNPFLLTLSLEALPAVVESKTDLSAIRITHVQLYDSFVKRWLEVNHNFLYHGIHYQKVLATAIFIDHGGNPIVKYTHLRDKNTWKAMFFAPNGQAKLLQESITVMRSGAFFRFLHRSLLEYFYSRTIYDPLDSESDADGFGEREPAFDLKTCLAQKNLVEESSIVQFLAERVPQDPSFRQQLLDMVAESKADEVDIKTKVAAANAITILVRAGAPFHGADLRGIKISGADLSGGQFDYAQFQGADLRDVSLAGSWLRQADLSNVQMEGVRFGESPYIEVDSVVYACAYSPDGKMLAVGLREVGLEFYDTTTWRRTHQVSVDCAVLGVAFSPDGHQVVSGGNNGAVRLWDCTNGEEIFVMEGHLKWVQCVAFSLCGKQIASASNDGTVRLWDSETGRCTFVLKGHTGHVMNVKYSVDGQQLVSGGLDATIRFWNPETGEPGVVWISSLGEVWSLAFSGDGRWIASGHKDGGLQFWHALSGEPGPDLRGHTRTVTGVAFSPDSRWIASSSEDETMRLWDASTGTLAFMTASHKEYVNGVAFSPSDLQIASGGGDRKVRLWEMDSVLSSNMKAQGQLGPVYKAVYSPNGQVILTDSGSRTVKQWDSLTGALLPLPIELPDSLSTNAVSYSLDGIPVALSIHDETIRLLEIQEGGAETVVKASSKVYSLAVSPWCRFIASIDLYETVELWELGITQHKRVLLEKGGPTHKTISCLAFSTTGDRLAVCSWNSIVWIFDSQSGGLVTSKELNQPINVMSFSPNDQQLATGTSKSWIHLWNLQSEKPAIELRGHTESILCIAYSPCGQWIVSSSHDKTVRLWSQQQPPGESESWSCVHTVNDFFNWVSTMAWSPTVPMEFVTGCEDQSVRVWRVSTDGEDVAVKMLWGTNLGVLHTGGSVLKGTTGLSLISRHLLIQRGAIDDTLPLEDAGGLEVEELEVDSGSEEWSE
ncbi:hypothetical protein BGW39_000495, partial [Mortierella sp. 14UC]